jgi:hypothetical protein
MDIAQAWGRDPDWLYTLPRDEAERLIAHWNVQRQPPKTGKPTPTLPRRPR